MIYLLLALLVPVPLTGSIEGRVVDAEAGTPLPGATVEAVEAGIGTTSRSDGSFALRELEPGRHTVRVRFVGYVALDTVLVAPIEGVELQLHPEVIGIEEVVVTGSPFGSTARYQAAQVFGRVELDRLSAASLGEMIDGSPGLAMRSMGPAPARPVIRGFDGDRVLILENGERPGDLSETAADHALAMDPLVAERVEVVRGPASLLYGSGAIGGVVNVLSQDIPDEWERGAAGDVAMQGSTVNRHAAAFARLRYGTSDWAAGGRVSARGAGDLRTPEGVLHGTDLRSFDAGLGAAYRTPSFRGGAAVSGVLRMYGLPEPLDDTDERVEIRMQRQSVQARGEWKLNGLLDAVEVRLHAGRYAHDEVAIDAGGEDLALAFDQRVISATATGRHGAVGQFVQGAVGVNAFARDLRVGGDEALTPDGTAARIAGFAFEELRLARNVLFQAAVRGEVELSAIRPNELFPDAADRRRTAALSGSVGLNARPLSGLELGLQVAQAFRSPTLEERYSDAPHIGAGAYEIGDPDLGYERALGADAFARVTLASIEVEAALFAMRIGDFVVYQPTGDVHGPSGFPVFVYEADDAVQFGGEVTAIWAITPALGLRAGADYVRATRLGTGEPLPRIPPLRLMLGAVYDRDDWWVGARLRAVDAQHRTAPNEEATEGYVLAGTEAGARLGPARRHLVTMRIDNIFDAAYRDHLSRIEGRHAPMPGRSLTVTYRLVW